MRRGGHFPLVGSAVTGGWLSQTVIGPVRISSLSMTFGVQWGDVAAWVGSGATSAALFVTYGLLRATRRDQRALHEELRLDQARKVSAWCQKAEPANGQDAIRVAVRLQNVSDEPIYGPRVAVGLAWVNGSRYRELELGYVLAPHYQEEHVIELRRGKGDDHDKDFSPPVEIIFSDAMGRFWYRDRYGGLLEIIGEVPPSGAEYFFQSRRLPAGRTGRRRR